MHINIREGYADYYRKIPVDQAKLLCPVPHPNSCRAGYAFRQHVEAARRNRGLKMIDEFERFPVFYFGNHRTVTGPGAIHCMEDHFNKLDFELYDTGNNYLLKWVSLSSDYCIYQFKSVPYSS